MYRYYEFASSVGIKSLLILASTLTKSMSMIFNEFHPVIFFTNYCLVAKPDEQSLPYYIVPGNGFYLMMEEGMPCPSPITAQLEQV